GGAGGGVHDGTSGRNTTGVRISGGTLSASRVYGNSGDGVGVGSGNVVVLGNTVYDNGTGIHLTMFFGTNTVANNLVYDSGTRGIWVDNVLTSGGTLALTNNTVMELAANAVEVTGSSQNVQLKNNILWAGGLGQGPLSGAHTAQRAFTRD